MKPLEIYAVLEEVYEKVRTLSGNFENVSANSAFAIGEALRRAQQSESSCRA
jgi:hypothetical protein